MRQKSRLIAAQLGLRAQVARREIGRIGLEQQALVRNVAHQLEQVRAAALVADPAGDADMEAEVEIGVQLVLLAGEAMRHRLAHAMVAQDLGKARMRVARVQEEGLAQLQAELELRDEPFLLVGMRRVVAVEVEAAFADGHHPRVLRQLAQLADGRGTAIARMVRMHAGGGMEPEPAGDLRRQLALEHGGPGDDDARNARHPGACHDRFEVVVEARVREIGADVGQLPAPSIRRSCSSRATPAVSRLSANAEPAPSIGAASHSRKQMRSRRWS